MVWQGSYSKLFIDGDWVDPVSRDWIDVISPYTEEAIAQVPSASKGDVDLAVAAARRAFDQGPWPRLDLSDRLDVMRRVSVSLGEQEDVIASLISDEMGCPITLSRSMHAVGPRKMLNAFIDMAPNCAWSEVRSYEGMNALVTREPIGVVAAVVPWNAPLLVTMIKLAPALLSGCTVILKPSPEAPLNSYLFAEILQAAGLPSGVVNILPADRDVSEYLVTHRDVDKVSFTGSTLAGRKVASLCGQSLKRVTLELGGKSAAIILDDANLDTAIESIKTLSLRNNGQACSNKTRIIVTKEHRTELLDRLVDLVSTLKIGDPSQADTEVGPLVTKTQRDRVESYIELGNNEGAKLLAGGGRPSHESRGWFVEPTLFADVTPRMRIAQEEIFGPVLAVLTVDDEKEAISVANDSEFGLNGSVFSSDPHRALAVARKIHTGTVEVNGYGAGFQSPIGGMKMSGIGREAGIEGFDAYVEMKSFGLPPELASS